MEKVNLTKHSMVKPETADPNLDLIEVNPDLGEPKAEKEGLKDSNLKVEKDQAMVIKEDNIGATPDSITATPGSIRATPGSITAIPDSITEATQDRDLSMQMMMEKTADNTLITR